MTVVANWKSNPPTLNQARALFSAVSRGVAPTKNVEVVVCPPMIYLAALAAEKSPLQLGAQNCSAGRETLTGEVTPAMIQNAGGRYVILGHSERRVYFKENDELLNEKARSALERGLKVVFCLENRPDQLERGLALVPPDQIENVLLVYEPLSAISTQGRQAISPSEIAFRVRQVREVSRCLGGEKSRLAKVLYGGSVSQENVAELLPTGVDGFLVGQASLDENAFLAIVKACAER